MPPSHSLTLSALKYADEMLKQAISVTAELRKEQGVGEFDVSRASDAFVGLNEASSALSAVLQNWPPRD